MNNLATKVIEAEVAYIYVTGAACIASAVANIATDINVSRLQKKLTKLRLAKN